MSTLLAKNRYIRFEFERKQVRKSYTTMLGEKRIGYVAREV